MTSERQIEANRRNAQKSTGPRTQAGKRISRLNAFRHGLTGQLDIMHDELRQAHDSFIARIVLSLKPAGALENQLAHSMAESYSRMNRIAIVEDAVLAQGDHVQLPHNQDTEFSDLKRVLSSVGAFIGHPERFNLLTVYEMRPHRKAQAELKQLREIQADRRAEEEKISAPRPQRSMQPVETESLAPQMALFVHPWQRSLLAPRNRFPPVYLRHGLSHYRSARSSPSHKSAANRR